VPASSRNELGQAAEVLRDGAECKLILCAARPQSSAEQLLVVAHGVGEVVCPLRIELATGNFGAGFGEQGKAVAARHSSAPSSFSSSRICMDSAGWLIAHSSASRTKFPLSS
jgi:hypothetical protein